MSTELENLISKRFIARQDVKAQQFDRGYYPVVNSDKKYIPWSRADLTQHLAGIQSFGHYLVNTNNQCKLFAFDIDLEKIGSLPEAYDVDLGGWHTFTGTNSLRESWLDRGHFARVYMKMQFNLMAQMIAKTTQDLLHVDVACAYSGNKGVHVYGFMPQSADGMSAEEALVGGQLVMEELGFKPTKGNNFYKLEQDGPDNWDNLSVEVFPKQNSINEEGLGNLMRLPLGVNMKNPDPTFFFGFTGPVNTLTPIDPIKALSVGNDLWEG